MKVVDEQRSEREYELLEKHLCGAGFEHYEISNYALPGYRSRHNSSYWCKAEYLGIGPGAHSYNGEERHWSEQSLPEYILRREYESEILTPTEHFNEYIMTALRCCEGIDTEVVRRDFGEKRLAETVAAAQRWLESGHLTMIDGHLRIPSRHFMLSDAIIESMFDV